MPHYNNVETLAHSAVPSLLYHFTSLASIFSSSCLAPSISILLAHDGAHSRRSEEQFSSEIWIWLDSALFFYMHFVADRPLCPHFQRVPDINSFDPLVPHRTILIKEIVLLCIIGKPWSLQLHSQLFRSNDFIYLVMVRETNGTISELYR